MNDHEWPRAVTGARQPPVYQNGRRRKRVVEIQASKGQKMLWQRCKNSTRVGVRARSKGSRTKKQKLASWYVYRETFRPLIVQVIRDTIRRNRKALRPKNDSGLTVTTANTPAPITDQSGEQPVKVATPVQVSSDRLRRTYRTRTIETLSWH